MPRYRYSCESCEEEFVAFHSFSEQKDVCDLCGSERITKMIGKPVIIKKNQNDSVATGKLTKEYIESNRELLDQMKEEAKNGLYE